MTRGEFVVLEAAGREPITAFVALASVNGASLIVMFDGLVDGCAGAMPLLRDPEGVYRNIYTGRPVTMRPFTARGEPA